MKTGEYGESLATRWYEQADFEILQKNYRTRFGEVDIIARKPNQWIVFVEVKTRSETSIARPCEWVTPQKQQKIILAAQEYLLKNPSLQENIRFDVVEVLIRKQNLPQISCIENAFGI